MKSILDSSFKYTPSSETDVRETFATVRLEQRAQMGHEEQPGQSRRSTPVTEPIVRRLAQAQLAS